MRRFVAGVILGAIIAAAVMAWTLQLYDGHTDTVVRVCWERAPRGATRPLAYRGAR